MQFWINLIINFSVSLGTIIASSLYDEYLNASKRWNNHKTYNIELIKNQLDDISPLISFKRTLINLLCSSLNFFILPTFPEEGEVISLTTLYRIPFFVSLYDLLYTIVHICWHNFAYDIHKIHHSWLFVMPISSYDMHPLEYMSYKHIFFISCLLSNLNFKTTCILHIFDILYTILVQHGGYNFFTDFHDLHHITQEKHFGIYGIYDTLIE